VRGRRGCARRRSFRRATRASRSTWASCATSATSTNDRGAHDDNYHNHDHNHVDNHKLDHHIAGGDTETIASDDTETIANNGTGGADGADSFQPTRFSSNNSSAASRGWDSESHVGFDKRLPRSPSGVHDTTNHHHPHRHHHHWDPKSGTVNDNGILSASQTCR
jgi:hypothetical protein